MKALLSSPVRNARDPLRAGNIVAIPSAHNRLAFAFQAIRACIDCPFGAIAVEFPGSFRPLLPRMRAQWPAPGILMVPVPPPTGHPWDTGEPFVPEGNMVSIPLSPADSMLTAVMAPLLLREIHPGWEPEIAFIDAEFRPQRHEASGSHPRDDWEAVAGEGGLAGWFERWGDESAKGRDRYDDTREAVMADRLAALGRRHESVLWVGGAAHWTSIRSKLRAGSGLDAAEAPPSLPGHIEGLASAEIHSLEAWSAFANGWLDAIPRATWAFVESLRSPLLRSRGPFRKESLLDLLVAAVMGAHATATASGGSRRKRKSPPDAAALLRPPSPRALAAFRGFSSRLLALQGRRTPEIAHLHRNASSTAGPEFARFLVEEAMRYPGATGKARILRINRVAGGMTVEGEGGESVQGIGDSRRLPEPPSDPCPAGGSQTAASLTNADRNALQHSWVRVPSTREQELHSHMYRVARGLAHRQLQPPPTTFSAPFAGGTGLGLDLRRSLRARVAGDPSALWFRQPGSRTATPASAVPPCDGLCPLVWIFDQGAAIVGRQAGSLECGGEIGSVYASFYWFSQRTRLASVVTRSRIAYFTALLREIAPYDEKIMRGVIGARVPPERRCQQTPWDDVGLSFPFDGADLAIACAVKYAAHHAVVVAPAGFEVPANVRAFAAERRIRILVVPHRDFDPALLDRLQWDHECPAGGLFQPPYPAAERLVEPVPW